MKKKDIELIEKGVELEKIQQQLGESRLEVAQLEDSIRREIESKKKIERMLKSYRDEVLLRHTSNYFVVKFIFEPIQVETLNEALNIAAFDIANAAGDQIQSDEDEVELMAKDDIKSGPLSGMVFGYADQTDEMRTSGLLNLSSKVVIQPDGSFSRS